MPTQRIPAAPLIGGVSRQPPTNRSYTQFETADNIVQFINRGMERRYGGEYIHAPEHADSTTDGTLEWLPADSLATDPYIHWIDRDADNRFCLILDGSQGTAANRVQIFREDGTKVSVVLSNSADAYLASGSGSAVDKLRAITVGDATFIWNKEVETALKGTAAGYANLTTATSLPVPATGTVGHYIHLTSADVGYPVGVWEIIATDDIGPWYERVTTDLDDSEIDETTMPVRLSYDPAGDGGAGEFTLDYETWNTRKSGDSVTNPGPSFIGSAIDWITVFQDRMWFGSRNKIVTSQAGDLFNLWVDDWQTSTDSDPIDLTLPGDGAHTVEFMIPVDDTLLVIANGARQYEVKAPNSFTPGETNILATTSNPVSPDAQPVVMGSQVYFTSNRGRFTSLYEYFYNFDRDANLAVDLSKHCDGYLPASVSRLAVSETDNIVFSAASDDSSIYLNFSHWEVSQKVQNAFSRWVLDSDAVVESFRVYDNYLYILYSKDNNYWLERIPITPPAADTDAEGSVPYHLHMDRKVSVTGSYSSSTKTTSWTLPFKDENMDLVVLGGGWESRAGTILEPTVDNSGSTTVLSVIGDWSDYPAFCGKSYETSVQLSPLYVKDQNGQVVDGVLSVLRMITHFDDTPFFEVDVQPKGRAAKTKRYISNRLGSSYTGQFTQADYGQVPISIKGKGRDTKITFKSSSPLPMLITNLDFICNFAPLKQNSAKG